MYKSKMLLVFNPKSGKGDMALNLFEVVDLFVKNGFEVTVHPTQCKSECTEIILQRCERFDYIVVSGGDGTLNEAITALMQCENRPMFGYLPAGTANDFATSLNLPKDLLHCAATVIDGVPFAVDIGQFGEKYFAYVAAFGMFTEVTYNTPQDRKNLFGHAAYFFEGLLSLGSITSYQCTITVDGVRMEEELIVGMVTNSTSIGGFKLPSDNTVLLDDGVFEVILVKKAKNFIDMQNIIASFLNRELYTDSIISLKASCIRLESVQPINWTLDGEFGGTTTDVEISNKMRAIEILTPQKLDD